MRTIFSVTEINIFFSEKKTKITKTTTMLNISVEHLIHKVHKLRSGGSTIELQ